MRTRQLLWTIFGAGHLVIVVAGACSLLPDKSGGPSARMLRWYAAMSGADSRYGFFAPEVGPPCRARFLIEDDAGSNSWDAFDLTNSPEARLRLAGIAESAHSSGSDEVSSQWRKDLVMSWAAAMFTRHPGAVSVTVVVEAYDIPTMADYRAGSRPGWRVFYLAQVQRHAGAVQERSEP
jgi:hypothetical protein